MTNQERIKQMDQGKNPAFLKEIDELFKKPVISFQISSNTSQKESSEAKPKSEMKEDK